MARNVYSKLFGAALVLATGGSVESLYEVPTGYTAVVRDLTIRPIVNATAAAWAIDTGIDVTTFRFVSNINTGDVDEWQGHIVIPEGLSLSIYLPSSDCLVTASGYLLLGVAP